VFSTWAGHRKVVCLFEIEQSVCDAHDFAPLGSSYFQWWMIAEHLTYLRGKRLFKRGGITRVSYGGPDIDCTTYVVQIDEGLR
jgi:hypothetical protein